MTEVKRKRDAPEDESPEEEVFDVEEICGMRKTKSGVEYLIKWAGYPPEQNSWEKEDNLQCPEKVEDFQRKHKAKAARRSTGGRGKSSGGEDNSGSGARSPVKSEGLAVPTSGGDDDAPAASARPAAPEEEKNIENDEVETILGAKRDDRTGELMLYVKWKGDPKMTFYPAKELNRRIPDKVIAFYETRLRFKA